MGRDSIEPVFAINKELNLQFVICYTEDEFAAALPNIAEGQLRVQDLITGKTSPELLPEAFQALVFCLLNIFTNTGAGNINGVRCHFLRPHR